LHYPLQIVGCVDFPFYFVFQWAAASATGRGRSGQKGCRARHFAVFALELWKGIATGGISRSSNWPTVASL